MDEMTLLQEFGRDLEHPPPASLARQRNRLLRRREVRRAALLAGLRGRMLPAAVVLVTAAALLVPAVLLRGADDAVRRLPGVLGAPEPLTRDVNVLVLGSDKRGAGRDERADTAFVAHLPADGGAVRIVSIPRDLVVPLPECRGAKNPPEPEAPVFGQAFAVGGVDCAVRTIEDVAKIRIDHHVVLSFARLRLIVDEIGGVDLTLNADLVDPRVKLSLRKGRNHLDGRTALAFARSRFVLDGSDTGRIQRQQQLMAAVVERARSLRDPAKIARVVWKLTNGLARDRALTPGVMLTLVHVVGTARVTYATVPWQISQAVPGRLELRRPQAEKVFETLR